jgi:hypothetical protein
LFLSLYVYMYRFPFPLWFFSFLALSFFTCFSLSALYHLILLFLYILLPLH